MNVAERNSTFQKKVNHNLEEKMVEIRRWIFAIICPPAAVLDREVGTIMLVGLLTLLFWVPGVVAALFLLLQERVKCLQPRCAQPQA